MKNLKILKTYDSFIDEKLSINEGIKDTAMNFKKMLNNFKEKYVKGAWLYFALYLQKIGVLKKYGVEIYHYSGGKVAENIISTTKSNINEARIDLSHPNPEIVNVNAQELAEELSDLFESQKPVFIWGAPGIGKTDIVRQVGEKYGVDVIVFTLSVRDPVDFIGLPSIEKNKIKNEKDEEYERGVTVYNVPKIFPTDNGPEDKGGILFFDEMNRANSAVLSASLQLVLDRKLNEYVLPSKWVIFAAGNRKDEVPTVTEIEPALANRFRHLNLVTSVEDWKKWALSDKGKTKEGEFKIDPEILSFVSFNDKYFHYLDPDKESPAWASPRSWTDASLAYIKYKKEMQAKGEKLDKNKVLRVIGSAVGLVAATEFVAFVELMQWLKPEDLDLVYSEKHLDKDGKTPLKSDKTPYPPTTSKTSKAYRQDVAYAFVLAIGYRKAKVKLTQDELSNLFDYAIALGQFELGTSLIRLLGNIHPYIKEMPNFGAQLKKWSDVYHDVLNLDKKK
jgi:hypothetical protein